MNRILSVDGGGALGVGPLALMALVEHDLQTDVHELFQGFAGTSTGSIIASLLTVGTSATEAARLYDEYLPQIFQKRIPLPWRSKYDNCGLIAAMEENFDYHTFGELGKPLYIPYSDFLLNTPRVFDRHGNPDQPLSTAVVISCSAPTFFPPIDRRYGDGGLLANNPALIGGYGMARELDIEPDTIDVVSIGTSGNFPEHEKLPKRMGVLKWLPRLLEFWMTGNESLVDFQCYYAGFKSYNRIDPVLIEKYEMDDLKKLEKYKAEWRKHYYDNRDKILKIFKGD